MAGATVSGLMVELRDEELASPADPLGQLTGAMLRNKLGELFLVDGKKYRGVITMRYLMRRRALPLYTKAENVVTHLPTLDPNDPAAQAAELLLSTGERVLPVVKAGKLVGKVTRDAIIETIARSPHLSTATVAEVMTPSPEIVREDDDVERARHIMAQLGEDAVPVVDSDGLLAGAVTMTDLLARLEKQGSRSPGMTLGDHRSAPVVRVSSVLRRDVATVGLGSQVSVVIPQMRRSGLNFVVVLGEGRKVMGVVTDADLVELLVREKRRDQCYVQITGVSGQDAWLLDTIYTIIGKRLKQMAKFAEPTMIAVHVVKYHGEGEREKFSVRMRVNTKRDVYHENTHAWDIALAVDDAMLTLEKRMKKERERRIDRNKGKMRGVA